MTKAGVLSPMVVVQLGLWLAVVLMSSYLLWRGQVSRTVRLGFVVGGVLVFGFLPGLLLPGGALPSPVSALRTVLAGVLVQRKLLLPLAGMTGGLLLLVWVSNKAICGWGCPLGLLQDLLHRAPTPKWRARFWLSNSVRMLSFLALMSALAAVGLDWIRLIDPFSLFSLSLAPAAASFVGVLLLCSLFTYRPWCQFLCPFGLVGWVAEQGSLLRPRIDRARCGSCRLCVAACPTQAMADFYMGRKLHADCYACGACVSACPKEAALDWRLRAEGGPTGQKGESR